ncbi:MAG: PIN domain-containing protein [Lapillicoccus sp.]
MHSVALIHAASVEQVLYVLDSTVLIDYLRNRPAVQRVNAMQPRGDVPATTAINVEEVVRGLRSEENDTAKRLLEGLVVLPLDGEVGWLAGEWRRDFASRGVTLGQADCLVAAATLRAGATLATGNPEDFPMTGLDVQHWPVGA